LIATLIDTGIRINEALTLKRSKVDFDNLLITVYGKGNKERTIPISPELRKVLYRWSKRHTFELIFCNHDGGKLLQSNIRRDLKALCNRLGISTDGSFHKFRHTFGYNFAKTVARVTGDANKGIFHLQKMLGHTTLTTTRVYVDIQPEDLKDIHTQVYMLTKLR
jgi:integrase/recombinase XerD